MMQTYLCVLFLFFLIFCLIRRAETRRHWRTKYAELPSQIGVKKNALSAPALKATMDDLPIARVCCVVDGDTAIVIYGWAKITIRLDSIDCPEDGQSWGDTAKFGLMKLINRRLVRFEAHGLDRYGRMLATLYSWNKEKNEWTNVNERMLTLGHAWVMRQFYDHLPKDRQDTLNRLENWAKSKKVGLWHESNPVPPWTYRAEIA